MDYIHNRRSDSSSKRGPCSLVHSLGDGSLFRVSVGYKGAIASGRADASEEEDSETCGRAAKETFRVSRPGAGVCTLPGVGVDGAVTEVRGSVDLGFG